MGRVKQAKERLGVEITLVESREQSDYELNIRKLASQNCDMTVGVGFLLTDAIVKVAEEFPRSNFALIDAVPDDVPSNLRCYVFREEEGSFLAGYLAGRSKTGKIGSWAAGLSSHPQVRGGSALRLQIPRSGWWPAMWVPSLTQ